MQEVVLKPWSRLPGGGRIIFGTTVAVWPTKDTEIDADVTEYVKNRIETRNIALREQRFQRRAKRKTEGPVDKDPAHQQ